MRAPILVRFVDVLGGSRLSDKTVCSTSGSLQSQVFHTRPITSSRMSVHAKSGSSSCTRVTASRHWIPWCSWNVQTPGAPSERSTLRGVYLTCTCTSWCVRAGTLPAVNEWRKQIWHLQKCNLSQLGSCRQHVNQLPFECIVVFISTCCYWLNEIDKYHYIEMTAVTDNARTHKHTHYQHGLSWEKGEWLDRYRKGRRNGIVSNHIYAMAVYRNAWLTGFNGTFNTNWAQW